MVSITSWSEFSDTSRKMERYSRAHMQLKKLLAWWEALGEVEKASKGNITSLVRSAEAIISDERLAWMSTSQSTSKGDGETRQSDGSASAEDRGGRGASEDSGAALRKSSAVARVAPT